MRRPILGLLGPALTLVPLACTPDPPASQREGGVGQGEAEAKPAAPTIPEAPTFAEHVAPIVYAQCTPCHHAHGSAPFAFEGYDDVREHAKQIAEVTASGFMPPWLPVEGKGPELEGARRLSPVERGTLALWVEQGAPAGNLAEAPAPPPGPKGWQLGEPDLVLETGAPFELPADGADVYRNFVIPVPADPPLRFVRSIEIVPADPKVVHHGVLRVDLTGSVRTLDAKDPEPGFDGMVFAGAGMPDGRFIGWTPGKRPDAGSEARAWRLHGGSDLVLQLHLRPSGKPELVTAKLGLRFSPRPPTQPALSMELANGDIDLPPGSGAHVRDQYTVPADLAVRSIYPHAHYLGKRIEAWATLPDGAERRLLTIDDWDFDWQDQYRFVRPVRLPKGSTIHMDWTFDNSALNPHNPSSPPKHVTYGPSSTDEMAELILEVEPDDPRQLATLDQDFRRHWLTGQAAILEAAVRRDPKDADAAANLGAFRQLLGDADAAIAAYEQALRIDPDHVQANVELSIVLMAAGKLPRAVALLRHATTVAPDQARPHLTLANALRKQGDDTGAIASYRRAIELDEGSAEAHNNLGITLEHKGELAEAATQFERASELQPKQALFRKNLARVRAKLE